MTTGDPIDKRGSTDLDGHPFAEDTSSTNQFLTLAEMLGLEQEDLDEILANADYTAGDVTGDMATAGNFVWKGLVYIEGDYTIVGTPSIIGAVVVRGSSTWAFSGGSPCILFSSEALDYYLRQSLHYVKIGWKETSG